MTETDRVYIAIMETMKKYNVEQSIGALSQYITTGNSRYFTSTNNARETIEGLTPAQVLQDALRSIVKYEYIMSEKGVAKVGLNTALVNQAISEYKSGQKVSVGLSSEELSQLIIRFIGANIEDAVNILAQNPRLFESFLGQYAVIICNHRAELNKISNDSFPQIDQYFAKFETKTEKKMG